MAKRRNSISPKIRFEVFKRDGFKCQYCGASAPDVILHVDHIKPIASQGSDEIINLITSCSSCNLGKGPRELSDQSEIEKQRRQLEELNERRLQLEMLLEWKQGLRELGDQKVEAVVDAIEQTASCSISETGIDNVRSWLRKYTVAELLDAIEGGRSYLKREGEGFTDESILKYFEFIPRIASINRRVQKKPYIRDLYYIRGILRNRLSYVNDWMAIQIMEEAVQSGVEVEQINAIALEASSWTQFRNLISDLILGSENNGADTADKT